MRMLINTKSELSIGVNRLRHYKLFTIPSSYLNWFSFEVPTLFGPWSLIRAYLLYDTMTLIKAVGLYSFIHRKRDECSRSQNHYYFHCVMKLNAMAYFAVSRRFLLVWCNKKEEKITNLPFLGVISCLISGKYNF